MELVEWEGWYKDLRFIPDAQPEEVLLVDDVEAYVLPEQKTQWISVQPFLPPYDIQDQELVRVRPRLEALRKTA